MLKMINVSFKDILVNLNFEISYNENAIIYSGVKTGSTLFLKIIDNILDGAKDKILFQDRNILDFNEEEKIFYSYHVSFVFESQGLIHYLNSIDNILLPLKKRLQIDIDLLDSLIKDFNLKPILYKEPSELSDIETKLVNIARAIIVKPKLILYDELDEGMDIKFFEDILTKLKKYQNRLKFSQIFTTTKHFEYSEYKNFEKKYLLFNNTIKKANEKF